MSRPFRLGIFIVSALLVLTIGIFMIGNRQFLFSSTYELKTTFKNVAGLVNGAEVRVGGIHSGTVKQIQLPIQPGGDVTVIMGMKNDTKKVLRQDSVAAIQTEGLLGNKFVEISSGSDRAAAVSNGMTIHGTPPLDISDLMKKTDEILDSTKATMVNVQDSSDDFKEISSKIKDGKGTVGALINDKTFYERLNETTAQAKVGAAAFQENMQALKTNFFLRGFFNRRGYDDVTKLTANEISTLPKGAYLRVFSYDPVKVFEKPDSAKLKNEKTLNEAGRFLETHPFSLAVVVARAGMKGDSDASKVLTQARAMNVRDYLAENFNMDDTHLKTMGAGKDSASPAGDGGALQIVIYGANGGLSAAKDR